MQHPRLTAPTSPPSIARIIRAGLLPFSLSVMIMSYGCPLGIPGRFPFDAINVALLISFAVSVKHILAGAPPGNQALGFSLPRISARESGDTRTVITTTLMLLIPGGLLLAVWVVGLKPYVEAMDNIVVTVTSRIFPMYVLGAAWGWTVHARLANRRCVS